MNGTLSKVNYTLHTDAIKEHIIPNSKRWWRKDLEYAEEADLLNVAIFGQTAQEWKDANPNRSPKENMRDTASINELNVLANAESYNSELINQKISRQERFEKIKDMATRQLNTLNRHDAMKSIKKATHNSYLIEHNKDKD